jgi:hypothetical protein
VLVLPNGFQRVESETPSAGQRPPAQPLVKRQQPGHHQVGRERHDDERQYEGRSTGCQSLGKPP